MGLEKESFIKGGEPIDDGDILIGGFDGSLGGVVLPAEEEAAGEPDEGLCLDDGGLEKAVVDLYCFAVAHCAKYPVFLL